MNTIRLVNFRRSGRVLVAIGVLAAACRASAEDEGGIWLGPVNLSPTLDIGVFYESNPDEVNENRKQLMEAAEEDRFDSTRGYNIQPGLNLLLPGNQWKLTGRAAYTFEDDDSDYSRSPKDWIESLAFDGKTDGGTQWKLGQYAQQLSYKQVDEFSQDDRFGFGFNGMLGRQVTDKSGLSLGASYRLVDYEDAYLYDADYQQYTLGITHQLTERTDGILSLAYGINGADYDEVGSDREQDGGRRRLDVDIKDATYINASVGLGSRATEKLTYRALVGLTAFDDFEYDYPEAREYLERGQELDNEADTEYSFSYDMGLTWTPTERFTLSLSGNSAYESSEDVRNNSMLAYSLICNASYRFFTRVLLSGGIAYRYEDYLRNVDEDEVDLFTGTDAEGQGQSRQDDLVNLYAGLTFGVTRYASLYVNGLYSVNDSTIDDFDYDRYRISAGVALQY